MDEFLSWRFAAAAAAAAAAGAVRGFSGFGSAMVMTPAVSALYGPQTAVPICLLLESLVMVPLVPGAAPLVDWRRISTLVVAAVLALPVGAWLLLSADETVLRWVISGVVLLSVAILAFGWRYTGRPTVAATATAGAASGLLNSAAGMSGPPIIFYYLSGPDPAGRIRASFIVYFAIIDTLAVLVLWISGTIDRGVLVAAAMLAPFLLAFAWAGAHSFRFASDAFYRRAALAILATVAITSLFF